MIIEYWIAYWIAAMMYLQLFHLLYVSFLKICSQALQFLGKQVRLWEPTSVQIRCWPSASSMRWLDGWLAGWLIQQAINESFLQLIICSFS